MNGKGTRTTPKGSKIGKGFLVLRGVPLLQPSLNTPPIGEIQGAHQPARAHRRPPDPSAADPPAAGWGPRGSPWGCHPTFGGDGGELCVHGSCQGLPGLAWPGLGWAGLGGNTKKNLHPVLHLIHGNGYQAPAILRIGETQEKVTVKIET